MGINNIKYVRCFVFNQEKIKTGLPAYSIGKLYAVGNA